MFCPKCHTHIIDESIKFCSRCGNELDYSKRKKFSSFKPSINKFNSTFRSTMKNSIKSNINIEHKIENVQENNIINTTQQNNIGMTHDEQAAYSRQYSGLNKNPNMSHDEQAAYSRQYSGLNKNPNMSHDEQFKYNINYSFNQTRNLPTPTSENDYRNALIKNNIKEIINKNFSIPALFLGPLYLIYRKMTALGLILQIIIFYALATYGNEIGTIVQITINIIIASNFKKIYLNFINKNLEKIKTDNQDKSSTELISICNTKGGTKEIKITIILAIILYLLFQGFSAIGELKNNDQKKVDIPKKYKTEKSIDNYKYEIPNELIQKVDSQYTQSYTYNNNTDNCLFVINRQYTNSPANNYLLQQKNYYREFTADDIQIKQTNNLQWYYQYLTSQKQRVFMYANYDYYSDKIYIVTTTSSGYNDDKCLQLTEQIINSFEKRY